ncbi:GNAT family N-acetyltransferase [Nonomuraea sp. NPDC003804]|uniref:GNAT family N-acetyltransferase n=1 Tax=Nonomuraea sp. NPDC003804 TaxID=3154547 RepID=UPI0033A0019C
MSWSVRHVTPEDIPYLVAAVLNLVGELRGEPAVIPQASQAAHDLVGDEEAGLALMAVDDEGQPLGVATASYQLAVRTGGPYAIIQELWVDPGARGRGVAGALISALCDKARARGCTVVEVGLPRSSSAPFATAHRSYLSWGFQDLGLRMRKVITDADG